MGTEGNVEHIRFAELAKNDIQKGCMSLRRAIYNGRRAPVRGFVKSDETS